MPFAVDPDRPLARALVRVARGLSAAARDNLTRLDADPVSAVHDARRDIRAARAALRLMRFAIGEETYREQNEILRRAARLLSAHRDAHVLTGAFDELFGAAKPGADPGEVRAALGGLGGADDQPLTMAAASALLELGRFDAALDGWPRSGKDLSDQIAEGFAHTLRRARRRVRRAQADSCAANLHDLRKRAKDARDQLRILMPLAPKRFGRIEKRLNRVTDLLGLGRDQLLLAAALGRVAAERPELALDAARFRDAALALHHELAERALAAAGKVNAPPRKTARRLG